MLQGSTQILCVSKLVVGGLLQNRQQTGIPHQPIIKHFVSFFVYILATVSQQDVLNSQFALHLSVLDSSNRCERVMTYSES